VQGGDGCKGPGSANLKGKNRKRRGTIGGGKGKNKGDVERCLEKEKSPGMREFLGGRKRGKPLVLGKGGRGGKNLR